MAVPDFQSFFKPLLEIAADGQEHSLREARDRIAKEMGLTQADLDEKLPSGNQTKFDNRVAWAKSYFIQAKVLDGTRRGYFKIAERGRELLTQGHHRIDIKVLNQYPEFVEFHTAQPAGALGGTSEPEKEPPKTTPEEVLQQAYQNIRNELAGELLTHIQNNTPQFFERLVVDLMVAMGYGGTIRDAGQAIGHAGDEGIDGIIKEDRLGLDVIYLQAKKWEGTVGRPELQKFVGALHGKRAKKGVFITTGRFSADAISYVATIDPKVILIDGRSLASYMIDFDVGVAKATTYEIKKFDSDYFTED
jgi:restriction system protein